MTIIIKTSKTCFYSGVFDAKRSLFKRVYSIPTNIINSVNLNIISFEELAAAFTILFPSMVSLFFLFQSDCLTSTKLASLACILHAPFSFALHMQKAVSTNVVVRTFLFKFDACFIHVQMLMTRYAGSRRFQYYQIMYNTLCIVHIICSDPLKNPKVKNQIDILAGIGCIETLFKILFRNFSYGVIAMLLMVSLFTIHHKKLAGVHSSWVMHVLLVGPQYITLHNLQYYPQLH